MTQRHLFEYAALQVVPRVERGERMNAGLLYLNPSLQASSRMFRELNSDSKLLERFVVSSSQLVTDLADRHDDLIGRVKIPGVSKPFTTTRADVERVA